LLLPYDKYYSIHIKINKVRAAWYNIMRCNKFITTHQNSSSDGAMALLNEPNCADTHSCTMY
jgi:hypothetical protein